MLTHMKEAAIILMGDFFNRVGIGFKVEQLEAQLVARAVKDESKWHYKYRHREDAPCSMLRGSPSPSWYHLQTASCVQRY